INQALNATDEGAGRKTGKAIEHQEALSSMEREIESIWLTPAFRNQRPSPLEESEMGVNVIEEILWEALPRFYRQIKAAAKVYLNFDLPIDYTPVRFSTWMGGDRDGNPFVTANVTAEVLQAYKSAACELYFKDL